MKPQPHAVGSLCRPWTDEKPRVRVVKIILAFGAVFDQARAPRTTKERPSPQRRTQVLSLTNDAGVERVQLRLQVSIGRLSADL